MKSIPLDSFGSPRPTSRLARSLALLGHAVPGAGSIHGPKSSAALDRNLVRCLPGACISQGISHDHPLPGQMLLLVTGLVECLETQLAGHFQEGRGFRLRSGLGSSPGASSAPPFPQKVWQPRAKGSSQPGAEPENRVFPKKRPRTLPSGDGPMGQRGWGSRRHQQAPQHELQAPARPKCHCCALRAGLRSPQKWPLAKPGPLACFDWPIALKRIAKM